jgi:hypothetical protein
MHVPLHPDDLTFLARVERLGAAGKLQGEIAAACGLTPAALASRLHGAGYVLESVTRLKPVLVPEALVLEPGPAGPEADRAGAAPAADEAGTAAAPDSRSERARCLSLYADLGGDSSDDERLCHDLGHVLRRPIAALTALRPEDWRRCAEALQYEASRLAAW